MSKVKVAVRVRPMNKRGERYVLNVASRERGREGRWTPYCVL